MLYGLSLSFLYQRDKEAVLMRIEEGNFPGIVTDFVFRRMAETCLPA